MLRNFTDRVKYLRLVALIAEGEPAQDIEELIGRGRREWIR
jgi:hypothetical protein